MASPLVPSPLDCIGRKRFAFYPAIVKGGPNEWLLGLGGRSEIQAVNAQTGAKIWIDRQYIGAVSDHTDFLTVGLRKTLAMNNGRVQPCVKRVIEMPLVVGHGLEIRRQHGPAAIVAIRLEERPKSPIGKVIMAIAIASLVVALLAAWFTSASHS